MTDTGDELTAAVERARQLNEGGAGALVPLGSAAPDQVRTAYGVQLADSTRTVAQLKALAERRRAEMEAKLNAELAAMHAQLGPLEKMVKQLTEGVWTLNLYFGTEEQIQLLADGEPAPVGTPITLRQLVLAMDEESLVAAETGGLDAQRVPDFAEWITADPRHLQQVLPEPKGVVVLVPSRQSRDYGDMWKNMAMAGANKEPHWLIRNGEKLYLLKTNFAVTNQLLPRRDEFAEFFTKPKTFASRERVPIEPGTKEWLEAEEKAGERQRHYMRVMLILQGLADRTTVFHPLPGGTVNFLSVASQDDGKVRIINELDNVLTSGRPSFRKWQQHLAAQMRVGLRIVGSFERFGAFGNTNGHERSSWKHSRLNPQGASYPQTGAIHVIEDTHPEGFVIRYARTDTIDDVEDGRYYGQRAPKTRASCVIHPEDTFVLPIDLVSADDVEHYLNARTERHDYLAMIPALRAVKQAKAAERRAEEPFCLMVAGRIAAATGLDVAEVLADMPALVDWWKLTNQHHRPLVAVHDHDRDQGAEAKAFDAIQKEWHARRAAAERGSEIAYFEQNTVTTLRERHPDAMCIARRRDNTYTVLVPADEQHIWLHEHRYLTGGRKGLRPAPGGGEWRQVPHRTRAALVVLWQTERWTGWNHNARRVDHLTGPELAHLLDTVRQMAAAEGTPIAVTYREISRRGWDDQPRRLEAYAWNPEQSRGGRDDPGRDMVSVWLRWMRGTDGTVIVERSGVYTPATWGHYSRGDIFDKDRPHSLPWQTTAYDLEKVRLVWSDPDQLAAVDQVWAQIGDEQAVAARRADEARQVEKDVDQRWAADVEQREYQKFLRDHAGAADLWEWHRKTVESKWHIPHAEGLRDGIRQLLDDGADLTTLTVEDAIRRASSETSVPYILKRLPDRYASTHLAVAGGGDGGGAGK